MRADGLIGLHNNLAVNRMVEFAEVANTLASDVGMLAHSLKRRLFAMARGAIGQANINARELKSNPLPVPPVDRQRRFAEIVVAARALARVGDSGTGLAATLMMSLTSEMFWSNGSEIGTLE